MESPSNATVFLELLNQARNGDSSALDRLIREYESELTKVVKSRLGNSLRPYFDSVDLIQSVHKSVLIGIRDQKLDVSSPQHLIRLAALIVRRKIARHWRKHKRQHRLENVDQNVCDNKSLATLIMDARVTAPSPEAQVELAEKLELVLDRLAPNDRRLIELRLSGCTTAEASRRMQLDSNVLRAKLGRIRKKLISAGITTKWF